MKSQNKHPASLAGTVLAASPELRDPNFRETLVYIAEHDREGAFGMVLNRPIGKSLAEAVRHPTGSGALRHTPLYFGGPVHPEQMVIALFSRGSRDDEVRCRMNANLEQAEAFLVNHQGWLRVFSGYAGWGEGQLESELTQKAWRVCRPSSVLFNERAVYGMWPVFASGDERWRKLIDYLPHNPQAN